MGYGVRNDREEVSDLMRAAMTAEDAMKISKDPKVGVASDGGDGIILDEKQQLKKICDERLREFE